MAMKKGFLPALMAGMVVVGSTGLVNADTPSQTITGNDTKTLKADVDVFGVVTDSKGEGPEGRLTVELPTKMAFEVDQRSNLTGGKYTVKNSSKDAIDVYVSDFRTIKGDIDVVEDITEESTRANVQLDLTGNVATVNLAADELDGSGDGIRVANVKGNGIVDMILDGEAGQKPDPNGVDAKGAAGEFNMVFKIKKANA